MLIGLSVSLCIRDIAKGLVDVDDVDYIIGSINPLEGIEPAWDLPLRLSAESGAFGRIASSYETTYWRDLPEARHIFFNLYNRGKILLPRTKRDEEYPNIRDGYWINAEPTRNVKASTLPTIVELVQTCYVCPSEWNGRTKDGEHVYIRYRWGYLSVDIARKNIFGEQIGGPMDGLLDTHEMITHLASVINFELNFG